MGTFVLIFDTIPADIKEIVERVEGETGAEVNLQITAVATIEGERAGEAANQIETQVRLASGRRATKIVKRIHTEEREDGE